MVDGGIRSQVRRHPFQPGVLRILAVLVCGYQSQPAHAVDAYSIIETDVDYFDVYVEADRQTSKTPVVIGHVILGVTKGGAVLRCKARVDVDPSAKTITARYIRCEPLRYMPEPRFSPGDFSFGRLQGAVDKKADGSFFRIDQTFGNISFCVPNIDQYVCTSEADLQK